MVIHFTFDDGPHPDWTPRVLQHLAEFGARATFFVIGDEAAQYPDVVEAIVRNGSTVGNHTLTHTIKPATHGVEQAYLDEVVRTSEILEEILGRRPTAFRPPWGRSQWHTGSTFRSMEEEVAALGLRLWLWDAEAGDYDMGALPEPSVLVQRMNVSVAERVSPHTGSDGWVLLLHDGIARHERHERGPQDNAVAAVRLLLEQFAAQGCSFEPLPGS